MAGRPYLSVVIPAFDERDRLAASLPLIDAYLHQRELDAEVIVVDDGSTDGTAEVARRLLNGRAGRVLRQADNHGKGQAVRRGILAAAGRWVLFTDADLSTPIDEHAKLAAAVRDLDLDVAIGSRGMADSRVVAPQGPLRASMGRVYNRIVRLAMGLPFRDTQCGFKLLDAARVRPIVERMVVDGFAFDVELLFLCRRFGLRVGEVPVVWRNDRRSKALLLADPMRMLLDLARIRWRFRRGAYNPDRAPGGSPRSDQAGR